MGRTEPADAERGFYYNIQTGQVEEGLVSDWTKRIGPYATREEAEHALDIAAQRSASWDEADRRWRGEVD